MAGFAGATTAPRGSCVLQGRAPHFVFAGLPTVPPYLSGKLYAKLSNQPRCDKGPSLLSRAAALIGLGSVVHAQGNCAGGSCFGCYVSITAVLCPGGCSEDYYQTASYGGSCSTGLQFLGDACDEENGACGCDEALEIRQLIAGAIRGPRGEEYAES